MKKVVLLGLLALMAMSSANGQSWGRNKAGVDTILHHVDTIAGLPDLSPHFPTDTLSGGVFVLPAGPMALLTVDPQGIMNRSYFFNSFDDYVSYQTADSNQSDTSLRGQLILLDSSIQYHSKALRLFQMADLYDSMANKCEEALNQSSEPNDRKRLMLSATTYLNMELTLLNGGLVAEERARYFQSRLTEFQIGGTL